MLSTASYSVFTRPLTPHAKRLNPILRHFIGQTLREEALRLSYQCVTGKGYKKALSTFVHQQRGLSTPFLWEVRDFIDRMPGETIPEVYQNVIAGL
jgi:hypothetical protein